MTDVDKQVRKGMGGILADLRASVLAADWRLGALLAFTLAVIVAAYQFRPGYTVDVGAPADASFVRDFHAREVGGEHTFRWTAATSELTLPEVGYPYELSLGLNGHRTDDSDTTVELQVDGRPIGTIQPDRGFNEHRVAVRWPSIHRGETVVSLQSNSFSPEGDPRTLGVAVESISVQSYPAKGLLVIPPPLHALYLLATVALLFMTGERLGLGRKLPLAAGAVAAGAALLVIADPLSIARCYELIFLAALLSYFFTLIIRARAYGAAAFSFGVLLLFGVALSSPPDIYLVLAPFVMLLVLMHSPTDRSDMVLVVALSTFAIIPLLLPGVLNNSDQPIHLFWVSQLDALVDQGVLYSRWAPDQGYGWGGPFFNFYAPFSFYLMEGFHLAGAGFVPAMKATLAVGVLSGMMGTYLLCRELMERTGAVVAAVGFGYFPYFIADIHLRGEVGEPLAIGLIPLILWAIHQLAVRRRTVFLPVVAGLFALLMLSHNITSLFATPFFAAYIVFMSLREVFTSSTGEKLRSFLQRLGFGASALVLGLGLSAFFWLPAVIEKKYIWGGLPPFSPLNPWKFHGYYMPSDWLYSLHLSSLYLENGRHHPVGIHLWLGAAAALITIAWYRGRWWRSVFPFFAVLFPLLSFLQVEASDFFWRSMPLVAFIQYPWRLLDLTAICTSVLIGGTVGLAVSRWNEGKAGWRRLPGLSYLPALAVAAPLILASMMPLEPGFDERDVNYNSRSENLMRAADMRTKGQFLPTWVKPSSLQPKGQGQAIRVESDRPLRVLSETGRGPTDRQWEVEASKGFVASFDVNYFPGWQVYVDGAPVETYPHNPTGRVAARIPDGTHLLELRFEATPLQRTAEYVSALSLAALVVLVPVLAWRRPGTRGWRWS